MTLKQSAYGKRKYSCPTGLIAFNLFTAMMSLKTTNKSAKFEIFKPFLFFSHWHVKGFLSKRVARKVDVLQDRKTFSLQARPCIFQPRNVTGWGSEGVKSQFKMFSWLLWKRDQIVPLTAWWNSSSLCPYCLEKNSQALSVITWKEGSKCSPYYPKREFLKSVFIIALKLVKESSKFLCYPKRELKVLLLS